MKNFIKNYLIIIMTVLICLISLVLFFPLNSQVNAQESEVKKSKDRVFSDFSELKLTYDRSYQAITPADFDGDGDIDIVTLTVGGSCVFLENQIPQKSK